MRKRASKNGVSVHAIAGTEVVLLGLDATKTAVRGLLGFSIYKKKGKGKETTLGGGKIFKDVHGEGKQSSIKSDQAPIQLFMWSDYSASPNTAYTYRVVPVYGKPDAQKPGQSVSVTIKTEAPDDGTHGVFFNRGVAGSQAYARHFGKHRRLYKIPMGFSGREIWKEFVKPEDVPDREANKWLSRGLEEAMLDYIGQARGEEYGLRAAIYELTHMPAIQAFVDAFESGADVQIVHHGKTVRDFDLKSNAKAVTTVKYDDGRTSTIKKKEVLEFRPKDGVARAAHACISRIGLRPEPDRAAWKKKLRRFEKMFTDRTNTTIAHNKFIVLLKNGKPVQVWTGSTNFTGGGIYGQSNVGHIVRDEEVAQRYLDYWEKVHGDPEKSKPKTDDDSAGMKYWTVNQQPDLTGAPPADSITPVFSPRSSNAMLNWYADRMSKAKNSVHFTAAFSVANQIFEKVTKNKKTADGAPYQRYLLLEGIGGLMKDKYPVMAKCKQNSIAWGEIMKTREGVHQEIETLTGLNDHVNYLHTKYMLIDPLSDDPVVITGSANFSDASTVNNDENMLIIRGNTRVADIFLGEFMRLFNHFRARNIANAQTEAQAEESQYLIPNSTWTKAYYIKGDPREQERLLFK
jgi:phosphatidylserine/phosphatidylglycerophosphate/cardiolipin synthase-like enzyme